MTLQKTLPWTLGAALAVTAVLLLTLGDAPQEGPIPSRDPDVQRVRVAAAERLTTAARWTFSGTTRASRRARLAFEISGRLEARPVEIGDRVRRGQLLARLEGRAQEHLLAAAEAELAASEEALAQRRRERERAERLAAASAITEQEREAIVSAAESAIAVRDAALARVEEARRQTSEALLEAPFASIVRDVGAEPGELVAAGVSVVELDAEGATEVEIGVPESLLVELEEGDSVRVRLPFDGDREVAGRIESLGRSVSGPGELFPLIVALDDLALRPGMTVEVVISPQDAAALLVPQEAVVSPGGRATGVFVVERGLVDRRPVVARELRGRRVVVSGDLSEGEEVVISGHQTLQSGDAVEVLR